MVLGDVASGRKPLPPTAITLVKGGKPNQKKTLPPPTIDVKRQIKGAPQAELYIPNVNRLKSILDRRLNRKEDGPGYISFPRDMDARHLAELRAETKIGDLWQREPHRNNETWDLYIYAYTVVLRFGGTDATLAWVPDWARPPKGGPVRLDPAAVAALRGPAADGAEGAKAEPVPVQRIGARKVGAKAANRGRRKVRSVGNR
jgi:phage terminase large subunit GpA-like protein